MVAMKLLYRCPLWLALGVLIVASVGISCSRSQRQAQILAEAEVLVCSDPDSALALLNDIDVSDIAEDSLKALYYLLNASAHKINECSMVSDSLIRFSFEYYRNRDRDRFLRSGDLYALHLFWAGNGKGALALLDSIISLPDVPDR